MICNIEIFLILLVEWLLVTETASQSYTRSYDGYVFTLPGLSVSRKKDEAQTWCTQNGSKLLEINSSYVQNLAVQFLSYSGVFQFADGTHLFTNGIRNGGSWNWVNGQDLNSITITGQGPDLTNGFGYINFSPSRLYIAASIPTVMRGYICQEIAVKSDCTNGFLRNEQCYKSYSSSMMSWFDARNRCLNEGGDLASFDFINDDQELNSTLNGSWLSSSVAYWIGIRRQWWTWQTSNLEVGFTNWLYDRPVYGQETRCLCLYKSGVDWKWIECNCDYLFPFVCLTVQPSTPASSSTKQAKTTTSSGFRSITDTYSNPSTMETPLSTPVALNSTDNRGTQLGIGIGVGIGGLLIIAAIVIAVVFFVIRKPGCPRKSPPSNPPDVTLHPIESHYVVIPRQPGFENNSASDASSNQFTPPAVYADLEILTGSPLSHEKDSISLINPRTATLAPPSTHKATTHFTVDGQEYAEVKEVRI